MDSTTEPLGEFPDEWMTCAEAAKYARCTREKFEQLVKVGAIRAYTPWSTWRLVSRTELDQFIRAHPAVVNAAPQMEVVK